MPIKNRIITMKKINVFSTLLATFFISTASVAAVPSSDIIKAEPMKQETLINQAKENLTISFSTVKIEANFTQLETKSTLAEQKVDANKNKAMTIAKATILAE